MNNNYLSKNNDQPKKSEVVIVGGGIVGAACFYYLTQQGIEVTLIEKNGLSMGTSRGGQGGVGYELEANDWEMLWYRSCFNEYQKILAEGFQIEVVSKGGLIIGDSEKEVELLITLSNKLKDKKYPVKWIDQKDLRDIEPNLSHHLSGAVYAKERIGVSSIKVSSQLVKRAVEKGGKLCLHTELNDIKLINNKVNAVITSCGKISTSNIIIAAGVWSRFIAQKIKLDLPVWPLKGHIMVTTPLFNILNHYLSDIKYQFTENQTLKANIGDNGPTDVEPQVAPVLQPLKAGPILIGSSREFANFDRSIVKKRLKELSQKAINLIPKLSKVSIQKIYTGLRPWTPDSRPIIGESTMYRGIYFATGHSGSGITGSLFTGKIISKLIRNKPMPFDMLPVQPDRFNI